MIMQLLIVAFIVLVIRLFRSKRYDSLSKRIIIIYSILWGTVIYISSFGFLDFNPPSNEVLLMMAVHVLAFIIGFSIVPISTLEVRQFSIDTLDRKLDQLTSNKFFIIITCILSAYIVSLVVKFFSLIALMDVADLRTDFYESNIYGTLFSIINGPILSPFNLLLIPVFSWMFFRKRNLLTLIQGIYLFGYASLGGGRFGFVRIGIGLLFVGFCIYLDKSNKIRRIRQLVFLTLAIVAIIGLMTTLRLDVDVNGKGGFNTAVESTSQQVLSYAVGPISAFDYAITNDYVDRIGGFKYGGLTLSAPELFIYIILNKTGIKYGKAIDDLVVIKQDEYISIGDGVWWNALYTSVLFYYLDLGWIGIIVFPFIFGLISRFLIKKMYKTSSMCCFIIITYVFHELLRSITDYTFVDVFTFMFMCILLFLSSSERLKS